MDKLLKRLSSMVYRGLKKKGVPVPTEQYQRAKIKSAAKGEWCEIKVALLEEIGAAKFSNQNSLFNRQLLERIEAIESSKSSYPFSDALFKNGSFLHDKVAVGERPSPTLRYRVEQGGEATKLTDIQQDAVDKGRTGHFLFLLGAPGTGKTRVISMLIDAFVSGEQSTLLCCHSHDALDHSLGRLAKTTRSSSFFHSHTVAAMVKDPANTYENIVIDEAGMVNLANVLNLTTLATKRMIFVGDPMQLPPIVQGESDSTRRWLGRNVFQQQSDTDNLSKLLVWQDRNHDICVLLREQFEIPERLFSIINQISYGNQLTCRTTGRGMISFIDTSKLNPKLKGGGRSPTNEDHAGIVARQLAELLQKKSVTPDDIGVLSPFKAQSRYLQYLAEQRGLPGGIEYSTVHSFQGRNKHCIVLDLTASDVDHTFQILSDDNRATSLMNTALSRCRTKNSIEGRLIVVVNHDHMKARYPNGTVNHFLERLRSIADTFDEDPPISAEINDLTGANTLRYAQTTDKLIEEFEAEYREVSAALAGSELPVEEAVHTLIWNVCDLIPRLTRLCNRLRPSGADEYFRTTDKSPGQIERLPLVALQLADLSEEKRYDFDEEDFKTVIGILYQLIYELSRDPDYKKSDRNPPIPIFVPDARNDESYGRIRLWLKDLRNFYFHDTTDKKLDQKEHYEKLVKQFFTTAIGKSTPRTSIDYLRAELFVLYKLVGYLNTVRDQLKGS